MEIQFRKVNVCVSPHGSWTWSQWCPLRQWVCLLCFDQQEEQGTRPQGALHRIQLSTRQREGVKREQNIRFYVSSKPIKQLKVLHWTQRRSDRTRGSYLQLHLPVKYLYTRIALCKFGINKAPAGQICTFSQSCLITVSHVEPAHPDVLNRCS